MDNTQKVAGSIQNIGPQPINPQAAIAASTLASATSLASIDATLAEIAAASVSGETSVQLVSDATSPVFVRGNVDADLRFVGSRPYKLGLTVAAASLPVVLASDQAPLAIISPAVQSIAAPDGALATLGSTADPAAFGMVVATISARLSAVNANLEKLADAQATAVELLGLQLQALNVIAGQLGGIPTITYQ